MNEAVIGTIKGVVKGVLSQVPVAGPIVTAVYDEVVSASLLKRREEWERNIEQRLEALEDEKIVEKLIGNESFVSCLIQATREAMSTHQHVKIDRLANAVVNSIDSSIDDDKKQIFLRWIERYSETHILVLEFLNTPIYTFAKNGVVPFVNEQKRTIKELIELAYPQKRFADEVIIIVIRELFSDGLIVTNHIDFKNPGDVFTKGYTTQIAKEFLTYIKDNR
ncbi:MAG: hypothetical protein VB061_08540 [Christensenella sp.]|nr:hypothetical protein [Christensenella sp.]